MSQRTVLAMLIIGVPTLLFSVATLLVPHGSADLQQAIASESSFRKGIVVGAVFWARYWPFVVGLLAFIATAVSILLRQLRVP